MLLNPIAEPSKLPNQYPSKKMEIKHVCEWMKTLNLTKDYSDIIKTNGIDGYALKYTTDIKDWNAIGITAYGDVKTILAELPMFSQTN